MVELLFAVFTVGSGVLLELEGRKSLARGRSRVPDLRERGGGDKDAILERSSSSGLIVTILFGEKVKRNSLKGENYTNVRLGKIIRMCVFYLEKIMNLDESKMYRKVQENCLEEVSRSDQSESKNDDK